MFITLRSLSAETWLCYTVEVMVQLVTQLMAQRIAQHCQLISCYILGMALHVAQAQLTE